MQALIGCVTATLSDAHHTTLGVQTAKTQAKRQRSALPKKKVRTHWESDRRLAVDGRAFPIRTCHRVQKNKHWCKQSFGIYQRQEMPTSAAQAPWGDATSKQACNWLFGDTADFIYTRQMLLTQSWDFFFSFVIKFDKLSICIAFKNGDTW